MLTFLRANFRWLACGFLLTLFSSFGQTFFIGLSGSEIRRTFHLSGGAFGGLYMLATLGSALTLPWLGRLLDIMPAWRVALFVLPALAVSCLIFPFMPNVVGLAIGLYLLRLFGQGMMTETAYTVVGRWFSANRGRAISLIVPGHQTGEAVLPLAFVLISSWLGWQGAWVLAAATILLVAFPLIVFLLRIERVPQSEVVSADTSAVRDWTQAEVVRDPTFWLLLAGVLAPPFIGTTIFFHQGYLIDLRGYDRLAFAAAFPVMALTTVIFGLVCGALIDRYSAVRILPFFLFPLFIAILVAALVTPVWGIYLFMLLFGVSYGFTSTLLGALWPEIYGTTHLGGIRAITVSGMVLATAVGPGLTGTLIDAGVALPTQLLWMAGWCVIASGVLFLVSHQLRRR
jgi:MFS family permease